MRGFFHLLAYDLVKGAYEARWRMALAFALVIAQLLRFLIECQGLSGGAQASAIDAYAYLALGMEFFDVESGKTFMLDIAWSAFLVAQLCMVGLFPSEDFADGADRTVLLAKSRVKWWLAKCVWMLLTLILFYSLCAVVIVVVFLARGVVAGGWNLAGGLNLFVFHTDLVFHGHETATALAMKENPELTLLSLAQALILPSLVAGGLCLTLALLSFVVGRAIALALVIAYAIASTYFVEPFFIGAQGMLLRNELFSPEGAPSEVALLSQAVLIVTAMVVGVLYFKRIDLLGVKLEA